MKTCYFCGKEVPFDKVGIRETCLNCRNDLHTCHNCKFYDETKNRQCQEPQALLVQDKDKYNRCDWFEFMGGVSDRAKRADSSRSKLEDLFKK